MYYPSSVLLFGKNKGYTLGEVYKYEPHYLEWLIRTIPSFYIEIHSFLQLGDPTPFDKYAKSNTDSSKITYPEAKPSPEAKFNRSSKLGSIDFQRMADENPNKFYGGSSLKRAKDFLSRGGKIDPVKYQFPNDVLEANKFKVLGKFISKGNDNPKFDNEYYELISKDFICKN